MYDQSLERLIQVSLADGILTEKEKEVICKKAESLGIDRDEIMVYVDGLLDEKNASVQSSKEGRVHICPNCGSNLPGMVANCPECGHEIRDNKASDSVRKFSDRYMKAATEEQQANLIEAFPVPNNKEDLLEFMAMAYPQSIKHNKKTTPLKTLSLIALVIIIGLLIMFFMLNEGGYFLGGFIIFGGTVGTLIAVFKRNSKSDMVGEAWETKMKEIEMKAHLLEVSDPTFAKKRDLISKKYKQGKQAFLILFFIELLVIIGLIIGTCFKGERQSNEENQIKDKISLLINEGNYSEAAELQQEILPSGHAIENDDIYYNFLVKCINKMCAEHEFDAARKFVTSESSFFTEKAWNNPNRKHYKSEVIDELNEIIDIAEYSK